jgi:putative hydrolase of the HAD superfamily
MIEAVTIDFWNTIVETGDGSRRKAARIAAVIDGAAEAGASIGATEAGAAIDAIYPVFEKTWFGEQRTLLPSECVALIWENLGIPMPTAVHERIVHTVERSLLADPPPLLPGAMETIMTLSQTRKLALISDTSITPGTVLREILEGYGLAGAFSHFIFSDELGVSKPHERTFRSALQALHVEPSAAAHIGDIERTDIIGAKDIGMKAILFNGKRDSIYRREGETTRADAAADTWEIIPDIISAWDGHP